MNQTSEKLKKLLLDPRGRIPRRLFILSYLSCIAIVLVAYFFFIMICSVVFPAFINGLFILLFYVMINYVFAVIHIKRLHDLNQTGWLWLIIYIPLLNLFLFIYLVFF